MAWTWWYEDADGQPLDGPSETFTSQSDAESWLGQSWRELIALGAAAVVLRDGDRIEYHMELAPDGTE